MQLSELVAQRYIQETGNGNSTGFYQYEFNEGFLPKDVVIDGNDSLQRNLSLRNQLNRIWNDNPERRTEIAHYYVKTWGGIRRISDRRIQHYVKQIGAGILPLNDGIASWSKIATISDPTRYAILDARVSAALNCIKIQNHIQEPFFPCLSSQNKMVNDFNKFLHKSFKNTELSRDDDFYTRYLICIKEASTLARTTIQHIEMLLYTIALVEIPKAMRQQ